MKGDGENLPAVPGSDHRVRRWALLRDLAAFQIKLLLDGMKDLVLVPISLVAGVAGIFLSPRDPGRAFHGVLRLGAAFDRWVDLYGAATPPHDPEPGGVDEHLQRIEGALRDRHARGGAVARAKDVVDRALDAASPALQEAGPKDGKEQHNSGESGPSAGPPGGPSSSA